MGGELAPGRQTHKEALHMFVLDGAKARLVAIAMAAATAIPLFPNAHAVDEPKRVAAEAPQPTVTKQVKKKPLKKTSAVKVVHTKTAPAEPWTKGPSLATTHREITRDDEPAKIDPKNLIAFARKQLGKPYHYGASGPSSFDCSGFTMYVWRKAGVTLPHNSSAQRAATKAVPRDKARPGDIVFSPGHVGLYLGDGKMIHSPQTGDRVKISPIHGGTYGFGRPNR